MPRNGKPPAVHPPTGDPIADLADAFEALEVPFLFTGATALNFWGRQRASEDIDVVVHAGRVRFARVLNALSEAGYGVEPREALREASEEGHAVFAAPLEVSGQRADIAVDLILPTLPFEKKILSRAVRVPWFRRPGGIPVVSAEDLVAYKTIYFRRTEYSDDPADVESVLDRKKDLDAGLMLEFLGEILPSNDERLAWLRAALRRKGFPA
ncbi:MAG: nucleotidyl transferase AbiEii/AbiGii toxin family protein [Planctomycetes bacterium]|nr:nucleotidyl transferase AbiEii/AbiGii toxin family protein [Planctomycetota bacterium]